MARTKQTARIDSRRPCQKKGLPSKPQHTDPKARQYKKPASERTEKREQKCMMLAVLVRSKTLAAAIAKEAYLGITARNHEKYIEHMDRIYMAYYHHVKKQGNTIKRSVNSIIQLPDKLKQQREAAVEKFVVTMSQTDMASAAKSAEQQQSCKSGFVAHM